MQQYPEHREVPIEVPLLAMPMASYSQEEMPRILDESAGMKDHTRSNSTVRHERSLRRWMRAYIPRTKYAKALAAITSSQCLICFVLQAILLWKYQTSSTQSSNWDTGLAPEVVHTLQLVQPSFFTVVVCELLYQVYLSLDAARRKNIIQVYGICGNNVAILISAAFASLAMKEIPEYGLWATTYPMVVAMLVVIGLCILALGFIAWKLTAECAW